MEGTTLEKDGAQRESHWFQFIDAELSTEGISDLLQTMQVTCQRRPGPAPVPLLADLMQLSTSSPPATLLHCSNTLLELVHQLGRGSQLAVPGPLPSGSIKNCFHDYSAYASREQAFGRMFILHRSFIWVGYLLITCIEELPSLVANKAKLLNPALCNPIYLLYQINLYHICNCIGKVT